MTQNLPKTLVTVATVGFLIFYSAQKYLAAAPAGFNLSYIISVVVLLALTALIPLAIAAIATRILPSKALKLFGAAILPLIAAGAGFWIYWAAYLNPTFGVPLDVVMPRAIFPGVSMGVLMIAYVLTEKPRTHTASPAPA